MSKYQTYKIATVKRSSINLADYNPRVITEHAQKQLRKKIKDVGLLSPLIVNTKTGRLVSGHQRITQLDALEGYPSKGDYDIQIAQVALSEKVEKEMNVFLNNPSAQGEFDMELLRELIEAGDVAIDDIGFEDSDIHVLFEDLDILGTIQDTMEKSEATGELEKIKEARKTAADKLKQDNDADFYVVIVCRSADEKHRMLRAFSAAAEDQQYVRSSNVIAALSETRHFQE